MWLHRYMYLYIQTCRWYGWVFSFQIDDWVVNCTYPKLLSVLISIIHLLNKSNFRWYIVYYKSSTPHLYPRSVHARSIFCFKIKQIFKKSISCIILSMFSMFGYYSRNKQNNIKKLGDFKQIKNVLQQEPVFGYTGSQIRKLKRRLVPAMWYS